MDSFVKAAKLGLAKTVAAGQQQLQQRLAKYEQSQGSPASPSQGNSQYYPSSPFEQQSYGNASTAERPLRHSFPVTSPHGQGQYPSYVPPPPPPPPRPFKPSAETSIASSNQPASATRFSSADGINSVNDSSRPNVKHHTSVAPPASVEGPLSQSQPSSTLSQSGSNGGLNDSNTGITPYASSPSTRTPVSSGFASHASTVYPPPPARVDYSQQQLQPQPEPQPYVEPAAAMHPDPMHWTNRLRRAQESIASFVPSYRPGTSLDAGVADAQAVAGSGRGTQAPAVSAVHDNDAASPRPLRADAETTRIPPPPSLRLPEANERQMASDRAYTAGSPNGLNHDTCQASARHDPAAVAKTMGNLIFESEKQGPPPAQSSPERSPAAAKVSQLPPMAANGAPRDVVWHCPEGRVVDYPLYWYQLPDEPDFLICTKCHHDYIKSTHLESRFNRILAAPESQSTCRFWSPRVKDCLWTHALQSSDTGHLRSFMKRRLTIPNCKGPVAVTGKENFKWFGLVNKDIKGFIVCEACHEDKIIGTSFQSQFTPSAQEQGPNDEWSCDAALPYIARAIEIMSKIGDWSGFVSGASRRMTRAACEGKDIAWNEGIWFAPRRKINDYYVCGACYMDKLELTAFEHEFEPVATTVGFDTWMNMLGTRWTCKLASSNIPMCFVLDTYLNKKDFDGFWSMTSVVNPLVPCTAKGIIRGNWWTTAGGCPEFSICEACYNGVFKTSQLDKFLEPAARNPQDTIVCSFCPAAPRFAQYIRRFAEAMDRGVFSYYADYVDKFARIPMCPGLDHRENSTWWGYDQVLFCEDCYLGFVSDTRLGAHHLQYYGASDERAQICQMWSPRMRRLWLQVCDAGPPESVESNDALDKFKAFGERRLQVFLQTIPRIKFIKGMKEMRMMNAMHQGHLSIMYSGMNSMAVISDTTDGYMHGNSSLGWYETEHGATGAQMFNNMQAGFADANRMDEWTQVLQLQMLWSEVE